MKNLPTRFKVNFIMNVVLESRDESWEVENEINKAHWEVSNRKKSLSLIFIFGLVNFLLIRLTYPIIVS